MGRSRRPAASIPARRLPPGHIGLRLPNLANYDRGLAEIYRVLNTEGEAGILDFGEPKGLIGQLYRVYFHRVLPAIGTVISGVRGPYTYLPASVLRFPPPEEMLQRMRDAGFREVTWTPYTSALGG